MIMFLLQQHGYDYFHEHGLSEDFCAVYFF